MNTLQFLTVLILLMVLLMLHTEGLPFWACAASTFGLICCWFAALTTEVRSW